MNHQSDRNAERTQGRTRYTPKHYWNTRELRFIKDNWKSMNDVELGAALGGLSYEQVAQQRRKMGIKRPLNTEKIAALGFKPGNVPHNISRKGLPFLRKDNDGKKRWYIVLYTPGKPRRCMSLGRYVWIKAGREVPAGKFIMQVTGDPAAPKLEDLRAMTRAEVASIANSRIPTATRSDACRRARAKQLRDKALRAYTDHKPYQFAA